jgi:hypothetical protein
LNCGQLFFGDRRLTFEQVLKEREASLLLAFLLARLDGS